jgi:hypothetical protein
MACPQRCSAYHPSAKHLTVYREKACGLRNSHVPPPATKPRTSGPKPHRAKGNNTSDKAHNTTYLQEEQRTRPPNQNPLHLSNLLNLYDQALSNSNSRHVNMQHPQHPPPPDLARELSHPASNYRICQQC